MPPDAHSLQTLVSKLRVPSGLEGAPGCTPQPHVLAHFSSYSRDGGRDVLARGGADRLKQGSDARKGGAHRSGGRTSNVSRGTSSTTLFVGQA